MADRKAKGPSAKGVSRKYGDVEEGGRETKGMFELRKEEDKRWREGGSRKAAFWLEVPEPGEWAQRDVLRPEQKRPSPAVNLINALWSSSAVSRTGMV